MVTETMPVVVEPTARTAQAPELAIEADVLRVALRAVRHAVGEEENRPILCTVLFEGDVDGFRFVAADNYRLVVMDVTVEGDPAAWGKAPIAVEDIDSLIALLGTARKGPVALSHGDTIVSCSHSKWSYSARIVDGAYPNYRQVVTEAAAKAGIGSIVNPLYLAEAAKAVKGHAVTAKLRIGAPLDPVGILASVIDPDDYHEWIMPVKGVEA